jgi:GH18 family chitinase
MEPRIDTVSDLKVHENEPRTSNDADSRRETLASDDCRNVETSKNRNPVTTKADPAFVVLSPTAQEFLQAQEITSALNFTATNTKELAPAWIEWSGEGASKTNGKAMSEIQCWKREVRYQVSAAALNSQGEVPDSHAEVGFAFPGRLHKMLRGVEAQGLSHIVSWHPLGHCFVVHKQKAFVRDILHK